MYKEYKKLIKSRMGEKRYIHSVNVAKEAVRLAKKYGADAEKAEIAGILHDITKETPPEEQLQIMLSSDIILSELERTTPKLWHSISGSVYVNKELGITDEDILNAIHYHTTGRPGMSLLEKVIFVADFTGAERDYDGVDEMRKAADISLDAAILNGVAFSISDLAKRKMAIHPDTFNLYQEMLTNKGK